MLAQETGLLTSRTNALDAKSLAGADGKRESGTQDLPSALPL
jgi:hypothetical protein